MAVFRWIEVFLFLTLIVLTAGAILPYEPGPFSFTVRSGEEVTLPCERNRFAGNCEVTRWYFLETIYRYMSQKVVLANGKMVVEAKADRLRVTEKCSLVIKKVTEEDAGYYICGKFQEVNLAVVTISEHKNHDEVMLRCSVAPFTFCKHQVKWQFRDKDVEMDDNDFRTSESDCEANVTFLTSLFIYTPKNYELLKCKVNLNNNGVEQLFSPQFSGGNATSTTHEGVSVGIIIMLAMRVAQILLLTVITVLLFKARGNQRPPADLTVHYDGNGRGDSVKYENVGEPSVSVPHPNTSFTHLATAAT